MFLIVYGSEHRTLFVLSRSYWDYDAVAGVASKLGRNQQLHEVNTTSKKMSVEFPGSLAFAQRHPVLIVLVAAVIILGLAVTLSKPG